ncbi:SEC-C domain-containing protein [Longimicrobium sp.]|jgi:hypothetical protein|uniref:YecA family protein n=1 Tax=Longimicrobium sp. TaxID=2029185 RepID=UPI002EDAAA40
MKPSRNDPCPCGSGKKYKACHLAADESAVRAERRLGRPAALEARVTEVARRAPVWEADVVPLQEMFRETGEPGSLVIVGAGGMIVSGDVLARRCVGLAARAAAVLGAVTAAGAKTGLLPERLRVRDAKLAEVLAPELERRAITVESGVLAELDEAIEGSLQHLARGGATGAASTLWAWAETEATADELAEFHGAAAVFFRAEPWQALADSNTLMLRFPGEDEPWAVSVMGAGGMYYGFAIYSDLRDPDILAEQEPTGGEFISAMRGWSLTLSFDAPKDLSRPMRREVASAGWELAGSDAYPSLFSLRLPGRRITAELLNRLARASRAIAAFTSQERPQVPFVDPLTGVTVAFLHAGSALPWPPLEQAHAIGAEGPGADPEAVLRVRGDPDLVGPDEAERLDRFLAWLDGQRPSRAAREREARTALTWGRMLVASSLPAGSATEYDLRRFLYEFVVDFDPIPKAIAKHLTRSLRRLFRYFAEHERIVYPWADRVLAELDEIAHGVDDVRDVLDAAGGYAEEDYERRLFIPAPTVPGLTRGWTSMAGAAAARWQELQRRWLIWYDEAVRSGITDLGDLHDVLVGRQRQWENTPHPDLGGQSPKRVLSDFEREHPGEAEDWDEDDEMLDDIF